MEFEVTMLGTAASAPTTYRGASGILVQRSGETLLFDCGEGTQRQLHSFGGLIDLDELYFTHYHADHTLGLPGLLQSFSLRGREKTFKLYGPVGLERLIGHMKPLMGRLSYELELEVLEAGDQVIKPGYRVEAVPAVHGKAFGYQIAEDIRPGVFDPVKAQALGVSPGPLYKKLQNGEKVRGSEGEVLPSQVLGEERPGRKLVISGDTRPCEAIKKAASNADLLIHEASFLHQDLPLAKANNHSTVKEAARLGKEAAVKTLALTHISARYHFKEILKEAKAEFPKVIITKDGDHFKIPFAEKGPVSLEPKGPEFIAPKT